MASRPAQRNWERIQTLFAHAAERAPAERAALLDRICAGNAELRAEIDSLLTAHDRAGAFLADVALETMGVLPPCDPIEGERVGPWRVLRLLGRGGMGAVYLAERADGEYEREVALKVVKRGMDTDAILGQFLRERQILAALEHPGIARLFDAGATADGRPYFVMERIEGSSLIRYCSDHNLGLEARVRLFCDVCRAVQYAHTNLVVHRDLKPSNILVTTEGQAKLLDFGIAKMLSGDGAPGHTSLTAEGVRPITPEYAAPEQLRSGAATTAADIYSLGAVLYELVTDRTPFPIERRSREDALQAISTGEPMAPSRAVDTSATDGGSPAGVHAVDHTRSGWQLRLTRARAPGHRLRGDLDTIILTALRAEPERRYATAAALLDDLERYLTGYPIAARPDTAAYRTAKFIRRHKAGALATLFIATTLVGSSIAMFFQQQQTARARDRAELRAAQVQEVADFLVGLFQGADPQRVPGTYTARELLDRGAQRLEDGLPDQPLTRARLLEAVAGAYQQLRILDPAARLFEQAIALREQEQGSNNPELLTALLGLTAVQMGAIHYTAAEQTLARAIAITEEHHDSISSEVVRSLKLQGNLHLARRSPAAAEPIYRRALAIEERRDPVGEETAGLLNNLGVVVEHLGRIEEAEHFQQRALDIRSSTLGPDHSTVAQSLVNLGRLAIARAEYARATEILNQGLAIRLRVFGPDHTAVAEALALRAAARLHLGNSDAAEHDLRQALQIRDARLGPRHPETAVTRVELARLLAAGGRRREASTLAEAAAAAFREAPDAPRTDLLRAETLLAELRVHDPRIIRRR